MNDERNDHSETPFISLDMDPDSDTLYEMKYFLCDPEWALNKRNRRINIKENKLFEDKNKVHEIFDGNNFYDGVLDGI